MRNPGLTPVVVGVNGTPAGLAAARLAAREAVVRGLPLRVVHVFTGQKTRSFDDAPDWPRARRESGELVAEAVATASRAVPGVHVEGLLLDGPPVRELLRQSRTAELLVIGGDDCAGTTRLPTDSVLVQTVSRSRCPVAVARGIRPPTYPVLTATDGSPSSLLALRTAAAEGRRRGVAVEVIHVAETTDGEASGRAAAGGRRRRRSGAADGPDPAHDRRARGKSGPRGPAGPHDDRGAARRRRRNVARRRGLAVTAPMCMSNRVCTRKPCRGHPVGGYRANGGGALIS
nr:hypothetical protein GCM10020092_043330 [Actinoplanes digitatis]